MNNVTATYKVGTNKGRPRIWIDGKRLADAGFVGGTTYFCQVVPQTTEARVHNEGQIVCSLEEPVVGIRTDRVVCRKVTGRPGGKPIIDLLGRDVEAAFPGASRVRATFSMGKIFIERET